MKPSTARTKTRPWLYDGIVLKQPGHTENNGGLSVCENVELGKFGMLQMWHNNKKVFCDMSTRAFVQRFHRDGAG